MQYTVQRAYDGVCGIRKTHSKRGRGMKAYVRDVDPKPTNELVCGEAGNEDD